MNANIIWTVGHSNRPIAELIGLLTDQSISVLVDVRRFPGSKRQPQFAQDSLLTEFARVDQGQVTYPGQTTQ